MSLGRSLSIWIGICFSGLSYADTLSVPVDPREGTPANNLIYQGLKISSDTARGKQASGTDLSQLDPEISDVWSKAPVPAYNYKENRFPEDGATLKYQSTVSDREALTGIFRAYLSDGTQSFKFMASKIQGHSAQMAAELLRRLGYAVIPPKHYSKLTIVFRSVEQRREVLGETAEGEDKTLNIRSLFYKTDGEERDWVISKSDSPPSVTLRDVLLEPGETTMFQLHWGAMKPDEIFSQHREMRAAFLPVSILDVGEKPNLFTWELGRIYSNTVMLTHPVVRGFTQASGEAIPTYDDLRWIGRMIAKLTRQDWESIVRVAGYPSDLAALIVEKAISRRNQMIELLKLDRDFKRIPVQTKITLGTVKNGKLGEGKSDLRFDGHAEVFDDGDQESPVKDLFRYFKFEVNNSLIAEALKRVNDKLKRTPEHVFKDHIQKLRQLFIDCYKGVADPSQCVARDPYFHGPIGNITFDSSRSITAGNFYGSDTPVQLTDTLSAYASVGYFGSRDGLPKNMVAGMIANLQYGRHWVHLRPLTSLDEAEKIPYQDLNIDGFMKGVAKGLLQKTNEPGQISEQDPDLSGSNGNTDQLAFMPGFQPGEMIVITDTLSAGAGLTASWNLIDLISAKILGASPRISANLSYQHAVLSRTTITRTQDSIHVYIQRINQDQMQYGIDFDWWIKIASLSHINKKGFANTEAYLLPADLPEGEERAKLSLALYSLLSRYGTHNLRTNFDPYRIRSDVRTVIDKGRFLKWQWYASESTHKLAIKKYKDTENPPRYNPQNRTFFSHQLVRTNGSNVAAVLSDIMGKYVKDVKLLPDAKGDNPANQIMGRGHSAIWLTRRELTTGTPIERDRSNFAKMEHRWSGWSIKRDHFLGMIQKIKKRLAPVFAIDPGAPQTELINEAEFQNMGSLEFFNVNEQLRFCGPIIDELLERFAYPKGLKPGSREALTKIHENMISTMGQKEFEKWTRAKDVTRHDINFGTREWFEEKDRYLFIRSEGEFWISKLILPVLPWMKMILEMQDDVFHGTSEHDLISQSKWVTRVHRILESHLGVEGLIRLLGKDPKTGKANYYLDVKISGFKTKDSVGSVNYYSSSLGDDECVDPIEKLAGSEKILSSILEAKYLSDGY